MSVDIVVIIILCFIGLCAHWARRHAWLEWTLRIIYCFTFIAELVHALNGAPTGDAFVDGQGANRLAVYIEYGMAILTAMLLFRPLRQLFSYFFSAVEFVVSGQWIVGMQEKLALATSFANSRVFVSDSIPHMNAMWIYITTIGMLLARMNPENFKLPSIGLPIPVPIDSLLSYNLLGLVFLAFCGAGVLVARKFPDTMQRLGLVKPKGWHYGAAFICLLGTFLYDYLWSLYTHQPIAGSMGGKLATYNAGTFTNGGSAGPSVFLALMTGLCAGIGEETLMRGGLQPVFGIVPAGLLHGILHSQFEHAPILIVQVAGWSCLMGIVRRYTNTTTTLMTHVSWNLITSFLFAFNP